jgi:hypothetical protein
MHCCCLVLHEDSHWLTGWTGGGAPSRPPQLAEFTFGSWPEQIF